jgi:hypothetical protein
VPVPPDVGFQGLPTVQILDRETSRWMELAAPAVGTSYSIQEPGRYVDPGSGTVQVRFQSDQETISFMFSVQIEGRIR